MGKKSKDRDDKPRPPGFYRKEKLPRTSRANGFPTRSRRSDMTVIPAEGPIRIFLDDEREAPPGFVVARTLPAFENLLDTADKTRLRTICLDWHLGGNAEPGQNGFDAIKMILDRFEENPFQFLNLRSIWLHSSDIEKAAEMARMLSRPFYKAEKEGILEEIHVIIDKYVDTLDL